VSIPAATASGYHSICGTFTPSGGGAAMKNCTGVYVR
jgi:hypothetical protein